MQGKAKYHQIDSPILCFLYSNRLLGTSEGHPKFKRGEKEVSKENKRQEQHTIKRKSTSNKKKTGILVKLFF